MLSLAGCRVLVLEDEPLVAFDYADELEARGAHTDVAHDVDAALRSLSEGPFHFAILDVNIGTDLSWPVAISMTRKGIPYLLVSGFARRWRLPPGVEPQDCLEKPIGAHHVANRVTELVKFAG
jgi:DNA-binding response OmpR family regulator